MKRASHTSLRLDRSQKFQTVNKGYGYSCIVFEVVLESTHCGKHRKVHVAAVQTSNMHGSWNVIRSLIMGKLQHPAGRGLKPRTDAEALPKEQ